MKNTENRMNEFASLIKPLHDWLQDNYSPHTSIIIECGHARIVSDEMGLPLGIKD